MISLRWLSIASTEKELSLPREVMPDNTAMPDPELAVLPPESTEPGTEWEHRQLFDAVKIALFSLPSRFTSDLVISGVLATDLFSFNSSLGATIEAQVVDGLNELRTTWDPEGRYTAYTFVRQSQRFPDVVLRSAISNADVLMGIELKGWYALAKEGEPSFRYRVTPNVCAPQDLLVVYPWALSRVISGSPVLFQPYVESARYAALYRNYYWQTKKGKGDNGIRLSAVSHYYPQKNEEISDRPNSDSGGNFGRFARTGLMDAFITRLFDEELSGIPLWAWRRFFAIFNERATIAEIQQRIEQIKNDYRKTMRTDSLDETLERYVEGLIGLLGDR